jgi:hypothetical protein
MLGVIVTAGEESWSKGAEEICKLLLLEDVFGHGGEEADVTNVSSEATGK